jgi:hypothetical protein
MGFEPPWGPKFLSYSRKSHHMELSPSWGAKFLSYSRNSHYMELSPSWGAKFLSLLKKFSTSCGNRRSITVLTSTRHQPLSLPAESSPYPHVLFLKDHLMLPSYLRSGLPSVLFSSKFPINIFVSTLVSHAYYKFCPSHLLYLIIQVISGERYKL